MSFFGTAATVLVTTVVAVIGFTTMFAHVESNCAERLKLDFFCDCEKIAKDPLLNKEEIKNKLLSLIETSLELATVTTLLNATVHTLRVAYTEHVDKIIFA